MVRFDFLGEVFHLLPMATFPHNLEETLQSLPCPTSLPMALPIAHLTKARWFHRIVERAQLEPQPDSFFKEEILCFFYGGAFYRPVNRNMRSQIELPVAFVFSPSILSSFARYYPFDTGGMANGKFGRWATKMGSFEKSYMVNGGDHSIPSRMVYHLYQTNDNYLRGRPSSDLKNKPDPLPQLFDFFTQDLSEEDSDHRQCIIECQTNSPIPLAHGLIWMGFPDYFTADFLSLLKLMEPDVPQYWCYPSHTIFNPAQVAAKLEEKALEHVISRYIMPPSLP